MADSAPVISVVVPTFRRPDLLRSCLEALAHQTLPADQLEVVVVDDGSLDDTGRVLAAMGARMPNLVALTQEQNRGPAAARNRGAHASSAPLVLFFDDDVVAEPGSVETHVRLHAQLGDAQTGILGRVDWHPDLRVTPFMHWLDASGLQFGFDTWIRPGPVEPPYAAFYTANLSLPRALLESVGGFDERFPYAAYEDMELAWRLSHAGFRLVYHPEARVFHARSIDLPVFRSRMSKVGESAELLRAVQPDFPIDDAEIRQRLVRRRELWWLRLVAPVARLVGRQDLLARRYQAEISAAYQSGRARALERLAGDPHA
jgi:GT2 family glycosyltransferase